MNKVKVGHDYFLHNYIMVNILTTKQCRNIFISVNEL